MQRFDRARVVMQMFLTRAGLRANGAATGCDLPVA
jgi:hypothetical protein